MDLQETARIGATYKGRPRTCGLRLSVLDVFILVIGTAAGVLGWMYAGEIALLVPFVVGHFFLFCNVFRIRRRPELIWAALLLINAGVWAALGDFNVFGIFGSQLVVTATLIIIETRSPHYHGVMARRLNQKIDDYLAGRI